MGLSIKQLASLDMTVLSGLPLGLWKKMFHCDFKERRIMSFSLVTAQLFSLRLHGGLVPSMFCVFKRAAMVAVGWNFKSCFSFYNRTELSVSF